jgi:outer membrane protein OmpA-like peptidoglycan-associated protein
MAAYLNTKPVFTKLIIEGHTDSIGSDSYNTALSKRRAETIRKWLIDKYHLQADKIIAIGRGESMPIADNGNYQGRQLNRRVAFTIYRDMAK